MAKEIHKQHKYDTQNFNYDVNVALIATAS